MLPTSAPGRKRKAGSDAEDALRIKVVVRQRPRIPEDSTGLNGTADCVQVLEGKEQLLLSRPYYDPRMFTYDCALGPEADQETAYEATAYSVVEGVMEGFNGTVMCYGQTSSGKTYTTFGTAAACRALSQFGALDDEAKRAVWDQCGLVPRAVFHLFHRIEQARARGAEVLATLSFLQIYLEQISDLLVAPEDGAEASARVLAIREDPDHGVYVSDLKQVVVTTPDQVLRAIAQAVARRATASTQQNRTSSRSHAVLTITVEQVERVEAAAEEGEARKRHCAGGGAGPQGVGLRVTRSALTVVDLAGSERVSKSGSEGLRLEEAKKINKSVSALGNCVAALTEGRARTHVPFRDAKLTRLLTNSLGGNSLTCLCANVGPSLANYDETHSTLLFAQRAMSVRLHARVNERLDFAARSPTSASAAPLPTPAGAPGATAADGRAAAAGAEERMASLHTSLARSEAENARLRQLVASLRGAQDSAAPGPAAQGEAARRLEEAEERHSEEVHQLQMEIARQNVIIAQLQQAAFEASKQRAASAVVAAGDTDDRTLEQISAQLLAIPRLKDWLAQKLVERV